MLSYVGKTVLITGAAGAIGSQMAFQFALRGASLGLMDLELEPLQKLQEQIVEKCTEVKISLAACDITSRQTMHDAFRKLESELGPTNVIIANAGVALNNPIKNFSADIFEKQIAVNLIGMANTLEPILPGLIERKQGHIVALSSLASYRGLPHMAGYCASKAGVSAFLDSLRVELKPYGIHCTTICPSYIRSQMNAMLGVPTPGILSPEDAVNRMMPAIEKKKPYFAFPFGNYALLVMSRLMPTWMGDYLTRLNVKVEY